MGKSKSKDKDRENDADDKIVVKEEVKEEKSLLEEDKSLIEDDKTAVKTEYSELIKYVNVIAKPLASKKLTKRLYKTVKKASKVKTLRRGVKEVVKAIRKDEKGLVVIAGDISPIDVISHVPVMCEDKDLPYVFVPSKQDLGLASLTKRPTSIVMVKQHPEISDYYDDCFTDVKALPLPI